MAERCFRKAQVVRSTRTCGSICACSPMEEALASSPRCSRFESEQAYKTSFAAPDVRREEHNCTRAKSCNGNIWTCIPTAEELVLETSQ